MPRYDLTDEQWHRLKPLLPPQRPPTGRPAHDHRTVINGILFVLRGGCAWRDLPDRYGNWKTVSSRFYRWCKQGVWQRVLEVLRQRADARGGVDWRVHMVDSTVVRAHQSAAGARGGSTTRRWGVLEAASAPRST